MGGTKTKTYTEMSITPLMDEPEQYYDAIRRNTHKAIRDGLHGVSEMYGESIVDTRSLLNDTYLTSLGYNPTENIQYSGIDPDDILLWTKANVNSDAINVSNIVEGYATYEEVAFKWFHENYTYDIGSNTLLFEGRDWSYLSAVSNGVDISITVMLNTEDTVADYLSDNGYSSVGDVPVKGETGFFVDVTDGVDTFEVEVPFVYHVFEVSNERHSELTSVASSYGTKYYTDYGYRTKSDDGSTYKVNTWYVKIRVNIVILEDMSIGTTYSIVSQRYYDSHSVANYAASISKAISARRQETIKDFTGQLGDNASHLKWEFTANNETFRWYEVKGIMGDVESVQNLAAFPIIPIKENGSFTAESSSQTAIANKIGMDVTEFQSELSSNDINSAFVSFMVPITATDPASTRYLYKLLDNMLASSTTVGKTDIIGYKTKVSFRALSLETLVEYDRVTTLGSIGAIDTYTSFTKVVNVESTTHVDGSPVITYTPTTYRVLRKQVTPDYYVDLVIKSISTTGNTYGYESSEEGVTNSGCLLPLTRELLFNENLEDYCYLLARSMHVIVMAVQVVKIKWYQHGFGKFLMIIVGAVLSYFSGGWAGVFIYAAMTIAVEAGILKGSALKIVQVAMIIYGGYEGIYNSTGALQVGLSTASTLVQIASMAVQINSEGLVAKATANYQAAIARAEDSQEALNELMDTLQQGIWIGIDDRDPELFYAMATDSSIMASNDSLYDFDGLIEKGLPV